MPDIERVRAEHERLRAEPPEEDRAHRRAEAELRAENERLRAILDGTDAEAVEDVIDAARAAVESASKGHAVLRTIRGG
jgi:hypothetical protein